jgi:DNA-binding NtrC family response regulator
MSDALSTTLIGTSMAMVTLRCEIARVAATGIAVLLEGETGTGKELAAQAIHALSGRRGSFIPVNVATIPDSLFESQVFGHRRGAFTGALNDHRGYVDQARGGTLFLDEIASAPPAGQTKFLRVVESHRVRPVGATAEHATDFRLIAASNVPLHGEVSARRFREDLLYRICGDRLVLPPLRERSQDVEVLAHAFVARLNSAWKSPGSTLSESAVRVLASYDWPGNVRQLRAVVERAAFDARGRTISAANVAEVLARVAPPAQRRPVDGVSSDAMLLRAQLQEAEWDTVRVAAMLHVTRKTVYARIARLGIAIPHKYAKRRAGPALVRVPDEQLARVQGDRGSGAESPLVLFRAVERVVEHPVSVEMR